MENCGTNVHTMIMEIPFYPANDLSETKLVQKRVKYSSILGNKFPIDGKSNTTHPSTMVPTYPGTIILTYGAGGAGRAPTGSPC
jgi:hypothetical protein